MDVAHDNRAVLERNLRHNEQALSELRGKLIRTLGMESVDMIMKRAMVEVGRSYPAMMLLRCDDDQVWYEDAERMLNGNTAEEVTAAFQALNGVLVLVVARMLGREIALRLADGLGGGSLLGGGAVG